jgi:hypothetical protein
MAAADTAAADTAAEAEVITDTVGSCSKQR